MRTGTIKYLALMGMLLTSCNHSSGPQETEVKPPQQQLKLVPRSQVNGSAAIACSDFRKTMSEVSKGFVNHRELQQRLGSVYDHARLATLDSVSPKPPDDFGPSAEEMLRSIIDGNHQSFVSAADRFSKACKLQSF
jgi:hypothetical protein